ncbi:MAG: asparagine synthase C-terminal domain-containing protein [Xanthomonadales bacterium]|jgi:asparagine synthase (glutamine-hydrolysing)|nr:asparagine synthase C-terminal domain-containing protein [Xanthomonadales bacterium]
MIDAAGLVRYLAGRAVEVPGIEAPRFADQVRPLSPAAVPCDDAAAIDEFRRRMIRAVERALPAEGKVGISLSAGLDSTLIAAIAAPILARRGQSLYAYTYGFDHFPDTDERPLLTDFVRQFGIVWRPFAADRLMPLTDPALRPVDPRTPVSTIWREFKQYSYRLAEADGVTTLLNGHFGDHLYANPRYWFEDELRHGRWTAVLRESLARVRRDPRVWRDPAWRHIGRRLLGLPIGHQVLPACLTAEARALFTQPADPLPAAFAGHPRPDHVRLTLGRYADYDDVLDAPFHQPYGLRLRHPWRDPDLTALMLALPARFHARTPQRKWIGREAARGILPEPLRTRPKGSSLVPVFNAAMRGATRVQVERLLRRPGALWSRWIDASHLEALLAGPEISDQTGALLWRCAWLEHWREHGGQIDPAVLR